MEIADKKLQPGDLLKKADFDRAIFKGGTGLIPRLFLLPENADML